MNHHESINEHKKLTFSLGFLIAVIGAVVTATTLYVNLINNQNNTREEVVKLRNIQDGQTNEIQQMKMDFRLFIQKYDQDMNRYVRDKKETTVIGN